MSERLCELEKCASSVELECVDINKEGDVVSNIVFMCGKTLQVLEEVHYGNQGFEVIASPCCVRKEK